MSIRLMTQVWAIDAPDPASKLVLLKLADNASDAAVCWPSISLIVKQTGLGRSTVLRKLRVLEEELKWIVRVPGRSQVTTIYKLILPSPTVALVPQRDPSQSEISAIEGLVSKEHPQGPAAGPLVGPERDLTSPAAGHQSSVNHQENHQKPSNPLTPKGECVSKLDEVVSDPDIAMSLISERIFGRKKDGRRWSTSSARKALLKELPIPRREIELLHWFYRLDPDEKSHELTCRRRSERTLIMHWSDEVTTAIGYRKKVGVTLDSAPTRRKKKAWPDESQAFFRWKYGDHINLPATFDELPGDQKKEWEREGEEFKQRGQK